MLTARTSLLALLIAGALAVAGCGGSDDSAVTFVDTGTQSTPTETQPTTTATTPTATTVTTPPATTPAPPVTTTTPARTTPRDTGGATIPQDGGASDSGTGGTTVPNDTGTPTTVTQDPDCKEGTGPGHPERPQCEPVSGPDSRPDETG